MAINPAHRGLMAANGTLTRGTSTVGTSGTAQTVFALNTERQFLLIQNPGNATANLYVDFTSDASITQGTSLELTSGAAIVFSGMFCPTDRVSVNSTSSGAKFIAYQG